MHGTRSGWVTAYGWYFIARGIIVFLLPWETIFGHSAYTRSFAAIHIALVFVTGTAIIRRKALALTLIWTDIGLSAVYVLSTRMAGGRLDPRFLVGMLIPLFLAVWYTKMMWPRVKTGLA